MHDTSREGIGSDSEVSQVRFVRLAPSPPSARRTGLELNQHSTYPEWRPRRPRSTPSPTKLSPRSWARCATRSPACPASRRRATTRAHCCRQLWSVVVGETPHSVSSSRPASSRGPTSTSTEPWSGSRRQPSRGTPSGASTYLEWATARRTSSSPSATLFGP